MKQVNINDTSKLKSDCKPFNLDFNENKPFIADSALSKASKSL